MKCLLKKICFSSLSLTLAMLSTHKVVAMDAPPAGGPVITSEIIILKTSDNVLVEMPKSLLPLLDTLQQLVLGAEISETDPQGRPIISLAKEKEAERKKPVLVEGAVLKKIVEAAKLVEGYPAGWTKDQTIKQLGSDLLGTKIYKLPYDKRLEVLVAANYLGFELLSETLLRDLARGSVHRTDYLKDIETLEQSEQEKRWETVIKLVPRGLPWAEELARQYYILNKKPLPDALVAKLDPGNYAFSIDELMEIGIPMVPIERIIDETPGTEIIILDLSYSDGPEEEFEEGGLGVSSRNFYINDLNGLLRIPGIEEVDTLILRGHKISNLAPLAKLKKLNVLNLTHNKVIDLSPLSNLSALEALFLRDNAIRDLRPLRGLKGLTDISLSKNQIKDISSLANLKNLKILSLKGNDIGDIGPLATLKELKILKLSDNRITNLCPISSLVKLEDLNLAGNMIRNLQPLKALRNLEVLNVARNELGDESAEFLKQKTGLLELDITDNRISEAVLQDLLTESLPDTDISF